MFLFRFDGILNINILVIQRNSGLFNDNIEEKRFLKQFLRLKLYLLFIHLITKVLLPSLISRYDIN